jgi:hypothetical protein
VLALVSIHLYIYLFFFAKGWMLFPPNCESKVGRVAVFDGAYLHGVVGGNRFAKSEDSPKRTTLMIAFWRDVKVRPSLSGKPGSCRPIDPDQNWVKDISKFKGKMEGEKNVEKVRPAYVKPFFQTVDRAETVVDYESVFQGL